MVDIDVTFCRALLADAHKAVKAFAPDINLRTGAWVWCYRRGHWEFHGPAEFYWYGHAANAYDARYKGWMVWLRHKGVET